MVNHHCLQWELHFLSVFTFTFTHGLERFRRQKLLGVFVLRKHLMTVIKA